MALLDLSPDATRPSIPQRTIRRFLFVALAVVLLTAVWYGSGRRTLPSTGSYLERLKGGGQYTSGASNISYKKAGKLTTTLVAGRRRDDEKEVSWIDDKVKDITRKAIYLVDDPKAPLHLAINHGRESAVYLQYIIDHYDNLTDITFFMHAHGSAFHNNLLLREDSAATINLARRQYIMEQGYVNTRCDLNPGCPKWIKFNPTKTEHEAHMNRLASMYDTKKWEELYPDVKHAPNYLSAPCCSQFAATRDIIRGVPIETYQRLAHWIHVDAWEGLSGRIMENSWQYIFLGLEELCPAIGDCYCKLYGICVDDVEALEEWQSSKTEATDLDDITIAMGVYEMENRTTEMSSKEERDAVEAILRGAREKAERQEKSLFDRYAITLPGPT